MKLVLQNLAKLLDDERKYLITLNNKISFENTLDSKSLKDITKVIIVTGKLLKKIEDVLNQHKSRTKFSCLKGTIEDNRKLLIKALHTITTVLVERGGYSSEESLADTVIVTSTSSEDSEIEL